MKTQKMRLRLFFFSAWLRMKQIPLLYLFHVSRSFQSQKEIFFLLFKPTALSLPRRTVDKCTEEPRLKTRTAVISCQLCITYVSLHLLGIVSATVFHYHLEAAQCTDVIYRQLCFLHVSPGLSHSSWFTSLVMEEMGLVTEEPFFKRTKGCG